ncbi:hypothetical protein T11_6018 [Trichinella zimbabwensis]|uniref:Uncharacterized protein n=1 Tax=Trichinella zimbabwensis TaxID=268475 RepID=A0A0V1HP45_9BILA|nr:hypothetical protein T11_6018 [Trichinella zimbabwensis]
MVFFVRHRIKNANALAPHTARQQPLKLKPRKRTHSSGIKICMHFLLGLVRRRVLSNAGFVAEIDSLETFADSQQTFFIQERFHFILLIPLDNSATGRLISTYCSLSTCGMFGARHKQHTVTQDANLHNASVPSVFDLGVYCADIFSTPLSGIFVFENEYINLILTID